VRAAVAGAWLTACLASGAPPVAAADDPLPATLPTPETTAPTTTSVPPNETRILSVEPAPTTAPATTAPAPATTAATAATAATSVTPTTTNAEVRTDFAAVAAAAEASAEQRRRLTAEIAALEPLLAATEAALGAAQAEVAARQGDVETIEERIAAGAAELAVAEGVVVRLELSATSAADAVAGRQTPVARPPARGHTPQDQAALARQALRTAVDRRDGLKRALDDLERQADVARQSTGGASVGLQARAEELQRGRDMLAELRRRLVEAEEAAPGAPVGGAPGEVTLVPAPSTLAAATVPAGHLSLYGRAAATCKGLPWTILAAVGAVESSHGQSTAAGVHSGANFAGAMGPMQFLAGTWAAYGVDGDGDGVRDVYNQADAVFGAANYLCARGAGDVTTLRSAVWDYNHADWYVDLVLQLAARY
jgi:hypothetical protein